MNLKYPYYISLFYIGILLVCSIVFFKERMLFIDPAYVTFKILNSKSFAISEHRYGAFITQMFPWVCAHLNVPLKATLMLYSSSFYLFYISVFYAIGKCFNQKKLAILFAFYLSLLVTDVYFWPNNEVHQSVGWMFLFLGLYNYSNTKDWEISLWLHLLLVISLFFSIISHILVVPPFAFLWMYLFLSNDKDRVKIKYFLIYSLLIAGFIGLRYYLSQSSDYDGFKLKGIQEISLESILSAFNNNQSISIKQLFYSNYWIFSLISLLGLLYGMYKKKYTKVLLTIACGIIYFTLVVLTHQEEITDSNLWYFESQWMCLAIILSAPFVFELIGSLKKHQIVIALFVVIFSIKVIPLSKSLLKFNQRVHLLESLIDQSRLNGADKYYVIKSQNLESAFMLTWALPAESALLSSLNGEHKSIIIKPVKAAHYVTPDTDIIHTTFGILSVDDVNNNYFSFSNDTYYKRLENLESIMKSSK